MPPETTSCEGLVDFGEECDPSSPATCGDGDGASDDGACPGSLRTCTYHCTEDEQCPVDTTCTGLPTVCR